MEEVGNIARSSLYEGKHVVLRELLRSRRHSLRLTQAQLAARLGKSQHYVSRAEMGDRRLDVWELEDYLSALGLSLVETWQELSSPSQSSQPGGAPSSHPIAETVSLSTLRRVERARVLLEASCPESCLDSAVVEHVAAQVGWSADHLRRVLRATLGLAPRQIHLAARLQHAQTRLLEGNSPVTEIALACGFATSSQFAQAFRRAYGCTPREYRTRFLMQEAEFGAITKAD